MEDYNNAFENFHQVIKLDPGHVKARYGIGLIYAYQRNNQELAVDFYNQAIESDENFVLALVERGHSYLKLEQFEKAEADFLKAQKLNPEETDAITGLAEVFAVQSQYSDAENEFKKALTIDPENPKIRKKFSDLLVKAGKLPAAVEQLKHAINFSPDEADYYYAAADIFLKGEKVYEAKKVLTHLMEKQPENERAKTALDKLFDMPENELIGRTLCQILGEDRKSVSEEEDKTAEAGKSGELKPVKRKDNTELKPAAKGIQKAPLLRKKALGEVLDTDKHIQNTEETAPFETAEEAVPVPVISPGALSQFARAVSILAQGKDNEALSMFLGVIKVAPDYYQVYDNLSALTEKLGIHEKTRSLLEKGLNLAEKFKDDEYIELYKTKLAAMDSDKIPESVKSQSIQPTFEKVPETTDLQISRGTSILEIDNNIFDEDLSVYTNMLQIDESLMGNYTDRDEKN
jgi:tetratricopeptide (TPR) repeat protein